MVLPLNEKQGLTNVKLTSWQTSLISWHAYSLVGIGLLHGQDPIVKPVKEKTMKITIEVPDSALQLILDVLKEYCCTTQTMEQLKDNPKLKEFLVEDIGNYYFDCMFSEGLADLDLIDALGLEGEQVDG